MARNLHRAGAQVLAWNRSPAAREAAAADGIPVTDNLAEVGRRCTTVLTVLPDLPDVVAVLTGGLLGEGSVLRTVVIMGTVSPIAVAELPPRFPGLQVVDAPISGGVAGAREARLSIMVGGPDDAVAELVPLFDALSQTTVHFGPLGTGSLAKACNQLVVAATITALAEAVHLAQAHGVRAGPLLDVLAGGLASSEVLTQKRSSLSSGDHHGEGVARYMVKDLTFVDAAATQGGVTLPLAETTRGLFKALDDAGLGDLDISVVLEWLDRRDHQHR
jgi:2-hydroxy-3-oxopropionate reductase